MGIKLRDYMTEDKMQMTREEVREFLYEILDIPQNKREELDAQRKNASSEKGNAWQYK